MTIPYYTIPYYDGPSILSGVIRFHAGFSQERVRGTINKMGGIHKKSRLIY